MITLSLHAELTHADFSLHVQEELQIEGIAALFGPSGAGKTTLLRVIAGLERLASGYVAADGVVWQDDARRIFVPPHRRDVGYVFQDGRLFPHWSVEKNLGFAYRRRRRSTRGIDPASVIGALDLAPLLHRYPPSLSGGERQRVAIARALLTGPGLIMMDEPLSSLDIARKSEIIPYIERLPVEFRIPVLYVTHNVEELARLASKVLLLDGGRVVARGEVTEILERMDLWSLTGRLEAGAVVRAEVRAHDQEMTSLALCGQTLRIPAIDVAVGSTVRLRIPARDVALSTSPPHGLSIRNALHARILKIDLEHGVHAEVLLDLGGQHLRARITREAVRELGLSEGQALHALVKSVAFEGRLLA